VGDLSPHFSSSEFADRSTGHVYGPPAELVQVLEAIRALRPGPLVIVSGHRCCAHNSDVGGASQSRHIAGDAADFAPGRATLSEARHCGAVGVGVRGEWAVHVDVRPGPAATWSYD
jgi:zinc D-Ala-D-Ala carboxypeptidase